MHAYKISNARVFYYKEFNKHVTIDVVTLVFNSINTCMSLGC